MESREIKLIAIAVIIAAIIGSIVVPYNSLVQLRNNVYGQKAQIENVYQGRADKIPDLVKTVKDYAKHEESVFTAIANARAGLESAIKSGDMAEMENASEKLTTALDDLDVVVEAYPELKSDRLYLGLMDEIAGSVNRIDQERREYNKRVTNYNNALETFPNVMFAKTLGFSKIEYFEASPEAHNSNLVDFGD